MHQQPAAALITEGFWPDASGYMHNKVGQGSDGANRRAIEPPSEEGDKNPENCRAGGNRNSRKDYLRLLHGFSKVSRPSGKHKTNHRGSQKDDCQYDSEYAESFHAYQSGLLPETISVYPGVSVVHVA